MRNTICRGMGALIALNVVACGAQAPDSSTNGSGEAVPLDALNRDLSLGAEGGDVQAVHEYLTKYGYFPNEELARSFPAWRPLVKDAPDDPSVYDERMVQGVRQLQAHMGLQQTGIVDANTRAILKAPRCGVPDGITRQDPSEKFAYWDRGFYAPGSTVTWWLQNGPSSLLQWADARLAVQAAAHTWAMQTGLNLVEQSSGAAIQIRFAPIDGPQTGPNATLSGMLGLTEGPNQGSDMTLDIAENWTTPDRNVGTMDLETVVLHELGHALGLDHSSRDRSAMWALMGENSRLQASSPPFNVVTSVDDNVGISVLSDSWSKQPGTGSDIAVSPNGKIWKIGLAADSNGNREIAKFEGWGWTPSEGAAVRIAVDSHDVPWVVDNAGTVYERTTIFPTGGSWTVRSNQNFARAIAAGADGSVWVVGKPAVESGGNGSVFRWSPTTLTWTRAAGVVAHRIGVGRDGRAWIAQVSGLIFRNTRSSPASNAWTPLPGLAREIAVSPDLVLAPTADGYAWVIGYGAAGGDSGIFVYDEQDSRPADPNVPGSGTPESNRWLQAQGGALGMRIAAGPNGQALVVTSGGSIWFQVSQIQSL